ncbi:hypothetical protein C8Q78DRAFT_76745 [Trametes maxima]|nr:hypothetical protein C8Q78DRAFT_76745 [Trametes maxima]
MVTPTLGSGFCEGIRLAWRISSAGRGVSSAETVRTLTAYQRLVFKVDKITVGHIAENCSSEQRLCYNCRQPGHESAACPSPRSVAAKQCYSCGGVGHIQAECPSLRLQNSGSKCYVSYSATGTVTLDPYRERRIAAALDISRAPARAVLAEALPPAPPLRDAG